MAVTCKICGTGCQGCGRKCKCGWGANMIGIANSMFDLGMSVQMIQDNISNIYLWKRKYTPVEIYDYLVNGVELPERGKVNSVEEYESRKYNQTVGSFVPTPNPHPQCCYIREGEDKNNTVSVRDRCIYCNNVKLYAPKVCPSYGMVVEDTTSLNDNKDKDEHSEG